MRKVIVSALLALLSGCAATGIEGRLGFYREDTREQKAETFDKSVACILWNDCAPRQPK